MKEMLVILVAAILSENFVLSKFMGICPFLGVSKKLSTAVGMSDLPDLRKLVSPE